MPADDFAAIPPGRALRYRLLSHLPGRHGLHYATKLRRGRRNETRRAFEGALAGAAGGTCIDLGANLGEMTRRMSAVAGRVFAFEPDPWTAERLRENTAALGNVEVIEAAAGVSEGRVELFRSHGFEQNPAQRSLSSSVLASKRNLDRSAPITVRQVDFPRWLEDLDGEVAVLKIDIEGAEVALLERLFEAPALQRIAHIFVETHERRVPELARRTEALRRRAAGMTRPAVNMDWE